MKPSVLTAENERDKAANPGSDFAECGNGCPAMVVVPVGKFMMGRAGFHGRHEEPQHEVTIAKPFAVGSTEITFAEYDQCVILGACPHASDSGWGHNDRPVINVSWEDAKGYADWLSRMTGKPYRLLTEAEWEYAARARSAGEWGFGDEEALLGDYAWYYENSRGQTQPVAKKKVNAFGLFDMHGNVYEWVEDCYKENYEGAPPDGIAVDQSGDCSDRVVRGGSWGSTIVNLRSADRDRNPAGYRDFLLGFRVARTLTP